MSGWRSTYRYQQWCKQVIDNSDGICALCGKPVDLTLSGMDKWGPTADHILEVCEDGQKLDPANGQLAHRTCNVRKENARRQRPSINPSRAW